MKVLFAVHDEKVSLSIVKKYQKVYKEIISYKNVYYFNAIFKELQRDKTYDRVVIDEELEEFTSTSYEEKDKFIFNKLDNITDEASNMQGKDIPIILICSERRVKSDEMLVKLFGIGIYNAIIGNDRSTDEVCRLINSPRSKKDAKSYYKINANNVEYDPEHENDVSEEEMQNILSYFKKLGKNSKKYEESFKKIADQYNEQQMKVIIAILPQNIKDILEDVSPEYQKYIFKTGRKALNKTSRNNLEKKFASEKLLDSSQKSNKNPIVVPSSLDKSLIKKVSIKKPSAIRNIQKVESEDEFEDELDKEFEEVVEQPKRRGRPAKKKLEEDLPAFDPVKKKRGRPSKVQVEKKSEDEDEFSNLLLGIDDEEENELKPIDESLLRPEPITTDDDSSDIDDDDDYVSFSGLYGDDEDEQEQQEQDNYLPSVDDDDEIDEEKKFTSSSIEKNEQENQYDSLSGLYDEDEEEDNLSELYQEVKENTGSSQRLDENNKQNNLWNDSSNQMMQYENNYNDFDYSNYDNLLSSNRKVIAFVGTSKNGTSFIVNNIAQVLSGNGIDTAILDTTQNKNSYYIYNNNDDNLRNAAASSLRNLIDGNPGGMKASKNLSVYVEVPGQDDTNMYNVGPVLENLVKNHSAILIDCDFNTPLEYFARAQEIYLVQSMDVLTIQPLTAFLKELKNRDILEQNKIRVIVNKAMRLKGITPKQVVGGMSRYNNPEMSMMTELFDRNLIVPIEIPFDVNVYAKYVEGLADCNITVNKYPKEFQNILKKLSAIIYPLLPAKNSKEKPQKGYQYTNGFSNNVNNTLNNMKKNY